jgi:hypothetical protein
MIGESADLVLLAQLVRLRLHRTFFWFAVQIGYGFTLGAVALVLGTSSMFYCHLYWWTRPIDLGIKLLMAQEILQAAYANYAGLRLLARDGVILASLIGLVCGLFALPIFESLRIGCDGLRCAFAYLLEARAILVGGVACFLLLLVYQLNRMSALTRNVGAHAVILAVYLGLRLGMDFVHLSLGRSSTSILNVLQTIVHVACVAFWCTQLRPEEQFPRSGGGSHSEDFIERLEAFRGLLKRLGAPWPPRL